MPVRLVRALRRLSTGHQILFAAILLVIAYLTFVPLGSILYGALTVGRPGSAFEGITFDVMVDAYSNSRFWGAGINTVVYSVGVTVVSVIIGTFLAWVVERTNTPFRNLIFLMSVIRLIIPGLLITIAWIFLLGPEAGILNVWTQSLFGLAGAPFNVFSMPGMIFVEGLQTAPIPFLLMVAAFRSMDPSLEEAARASGAGVLATARRVTLPLTAPAFLAAALIAFVTAFESFETPALIGLRADEPIQTFATEIFLRVRRSPTDFNASSAYAIVFLITAMIGVYLYRRATRSAERFETVTGKGFRPNRIDLGRWRWATMIISFILITFMFVLPVLALLWRSLQPFNNAPTLETLGLVTTRHWEFILGYDTAWFSLRNSLVIALLAATVAVLLTALAAWIVTRSRVRGRGFLDVVLFIPIAMPGLVLGLSLVWFSLTITPFLYGTLLIIVIAHATKFLPYGMRFATASMLQISSELESAAYASGASFVQTFRRIILPLLMPGLVSAFIFVFVGSVRELSSAVLLHGFGNTTFPVALFDIFDDGRFGEAAALALVAVVILAVIVLAVRWIGGRFGVRV